MESKIELSLRSLASDGGIIIFSLIRDEVEIKIKSTGRVGGETYVHTDVRVKPEDLKKVLSVVLANLT